MALATIDHLVLVPIGRLVIADLHPVLREVEVQDLLDQAALEVVLPAAHHLVDLPADLHQADQVQNEEIKLRYEKVNTHSKFN